MRIIVSNAEKNHADALLQALQRKDLLQGYYTLFYSNRLLKLPLIKNIAGLSNQLRKYFYKAGTRSFHHRPLLFLQSKLNNQLPANISGPYKKFDSWVSSQLEKEKPGIIISFENCNAQTFRTARQLNIVTVLDLAQIHHQEIYRIFSEYHLHDELEAEKDPVMNKLKEEALSCTDYIFTVSEFAKDSLVKNGFEKEKIFVNHLGVNTGIFYPKEQYNASPGVLHLLFAGTISERKGVHLLLEAMKQLQHLPVILTLAGPVSASGKKIIEATRHLENVRHLSFLHHEKLAEQYRKTDIFVFPSLLDSWAQTVLEAMACGTPVIVTDHTGAKDAVGPGSGWVVKPGDVVALTEKILFFYRNRQEIENFGRKAAGIAAGFTWQQYYHSVEQSINCIKERQEYPNPF
jgi:glycosyltransferase involved in cell wall biosynthesis